jgi:hypothetical protein
LAANRGTKLYFKRATEGIGYPLAARTLHLLMRETRPLKLSGVRLKEDSESIFQR